MHENENILSFYIYEEKIHVVKKMKKKYIKLKLKLNKKFEIEVEPLFDTYK